MIKWNDNNTITVPAPSRPRKITGTKFASVLGADRWKSPFAVWAELVGIYKEPFTESKFTRAGQIIEPRQLEYLRARYPRLGFLDPAYRYGDDYKRSQRYDFFHGDPVYGGMWDAIIYDPRYGQGREIGVLEQKTTGRPQDWEGGRIPENYGLQAALYARLLGVEHVLMSVTFLTGSDYDEPGAVEIRAENTTERHFLVSERYPYLEAYMRQGREWYQRHVLGGISPEYDEDRDYKVLQALGWDSRGEEWKW